MQGVALVLGFLVLAVSWLAPGHYPPWVSFQAETLACAAGCLIGLSAVAARTTRWPRLAVATLAVALVPLIQLVFGEIRFVSDGVLAAAYISAFALSMVAGSTLVAVRRSDFLDLMTGAFVAASIISCGIALAQWLQAGSGLFLTDLPPGGRPYANLAQPNHLATLLALGLVGLLRWLEMQRISGRVAALGVAWLGFGLVLTQSRTGWSFVAILLTWHAVGGRKAGLRMSKKTMAIGVFLFVLAVANLGGLNDALLLRSLDAPLQARLTSGGLRWLHWKTLVDAVIQSPWVGYGWSQVMLAQQASAWKYPASSELIFNSHNVVLDLLVWNGVILGGLVAILLVMWFVGHIRVCRTPEQWLLLAGTGAIFLHALLEYPLNYMYFLLPLGLMMGALDELNTETSATPRTASRVFLAFPLMVLFALTVWVSVEYSRVEAAMWQLRFVSARIGTDRISTAPPPDVVLLDSEREFQRFAMTDARSGMTDAEVDWMKRVATRNPYAPSLLRYALAAGLNGRPEQAERSLVLLCKMNAVQRCDEGRAAWKDLQKAHAVLLKIKFPENSD